MSYERNKNTQVTGITEAVQLQLILQIGPGQVSAGQHYFPIVTLLQSLSLSSVPSSYFVSTFPNCCCHNQPGTIQTKTIKTLRGEKNMNFIIC